MVFQPVVSVQNNPYSRITRKISCRKTVTTLAARLFFWLPAANAQVSGSHYLITSEEFINLYKAAYAGETPSYHSAGGYAAGLVLEKAIRNADSTDPSAIKAALDSSLAFLAKSFSRFSQVRFNAVAPGLLKTSASAGIPGYVDSYLYAEQVTLRKQAVSTEEAANVAAFLLSPRSGGINAQRIVVDAGMSTNYFDAALIKAALGGQ